MQKKQWAKPQIIKLGVEETHGGPIFDNKADGDAWFDGKSWQIPVGHS